jgi:rhodanese-related sulfurtransferase
MFGSSLNPSIKQLNPEQARVRLSETPPVYLLDVRQPEEFSAYHLSGAVLIPLGELAKRYTELPQDREILCICESGSRSLEAVQWLTAKGLQAVNIKGGIIQWYRAGLPLEISKRKET